MTKHTLTRRRFCALLSLCASASTWRAFAQEGPPLLSFDDELHQSLPGGEVDTVSFKEVFKGVGPSPKEIALAALNDPEDKTLPTPPPPGDQLASKMLELTENYVRDGVSRTNNNEHVERFLRLFGFEMNYPSSNKPVAFCAAGLCFAACRAYYELTKLPYNKERPSIPFRRVFPTVRENYFLLPNPTVLGIMAYSRYRQTFVDTSVDPKPGWPVVFSWTKDPKNPSHIGLVKKVLSASQLLTLEFNTQLDDSGNQSDGGHVAERHRPRNATIIGYVKL